MTRLCLPHIPDDGHIVFTGSVAGRWYQNAARVRGREVRPARLRVRPPRGSPRAPDPDHDRRRRARRERVLARPLPRRRRGGEGGVRGCRPGHAGRDRRLRPLRAHAPAARERRRDRRRRPLSRPGPGSCAARSNGSCPCSRSSRAHLLPLRRAGRHRRGDERPLRLRHPVPLAARPPARRLAAAAASSAARTTSRLRSSCATRTSTACRTTRCRSRASVSWRPGCAGADRRAERGHGEAPLRGVARARRRLRGHHHGEAPRLRARRPRERAGPASAAPASTTRARDSCSSSPARRRPDARHPLAAGRSTTAGWCSTSISTRTSSGSWTSRCIPRSTARATPSASSDSPRSARRWATSSRRGRSACRGARRLGEPPRAFDRSIDDLAASGCERASRGGRSSLPACRGS